MDANERLINDIKRLIEFYEKLDETNPQIKNYLNQLHIQLDELTNPEIEDTII